MFSSMFFIFIYSFQINFFAFLAKVVWTSPYILKYNSMQNSIYEVLNNSSNSKCQENNPNMQQKETWPGSKTNNVTKV